MTFNNYNYLFFLPLLIILYFIGLSGIKDFLKRKNAFISTTAFNKLNLKNNLDQKYLSIFIWLFIIFMSVIALARPQGRDINADIEQSARNIVIAIDISDSMKATDVTLSGSYSDSSLLSDVKNLSRFEAAKKVIKGFARTLSGDNLSLVAFSDTAFPLLPLTNDYDSFNEFLANLDYSYSSGGGTNIGDAISVAEKRFYKKNKDEEKIIILISDGEEQNNNALEIAKAAKQNKVIIETIGIGSLKGSKIYIGRSIYGEPMYKTYLGQDVVSKLDNKLLKDVASITGGKYFEVGDEDISNDLFQEINKIKPVTTKTSGSYQRQEFFQIFIIIALFLIMIEIFIPVIKKFAVDKLQ